MLERAVEEAEGEEDAVFCGVVVVALGEAKLDEELEEAIPVEGFEYLSWIPCKVLRLMRILDLNLPFTKSEDSNSCDACIPMMRHMFR